MAHTKVNYEDVDATADAMHFLREPLGAERLGLTVVEADPNWSGMEHDHADEDHEEVYLLLDGAATIEVDGEDVEMNEGDALRVPPEATRKIRNGSSNSRFVVAGAP